MVIKKSKNEVLNNKKLIDWLINWCLKPDMYNATIYLYFVFSVVNWNNITWNI